LYFSIIYFQFTGFFFGYYQALLKIIDMSVSSDHIHLFIQYPPKYSVNFIAKRLKGRASRILCQEFPELKECCKKSFWAPSCYYGSVGHGWEVVEKYIAGQDRKS